MKKTIIAAAAIVAMTACNKNIIESQSEGYGYISLGVASDTELIVTKVGNYQDVDASDYNVMLYRVDASGARSAVWDASKKYSEITEPIKVAAGKYLFTAENQTAAEAAPAAGKGSVRVYGEGEVTLAAGATETAVVNCDPVNAMVTVAYAENFTTTFVDPSVSVSDGTRSLNMEVGHEEDNGVYYSADTDVDVEAATEKAAVLTWTLNATVAGKSKTFTGKFNALRATWNKITFAAGADGLLNITIKADTSLTEAKEETLTIDPTTGEEVTTPAE